VTFIDHIRESDLKESQHPFGLETIQCLLQDKAILNNLKKKYEKVDLLVVRHILEHSSSVRSLLTKGDISKKIKGGSAIITMLHPVRISSKRNKYDEYIHKNYLLDGTYLSNFLSDDEELPLIKYNFKHIMQSSTNNGLKVVNWDEPKIVKTNNVSDEEFEFYSKNESIFIVQLNRK